MKKHKICREVDVFVQNYVSNCESVFYLPYGKLRQDIVILAMTLRTDRRIAIYAEN